MREIKLRGINKKTNEWVYGDLLQAEAQKQAWICNYSNHEVIPKTVGQYTGIHDNTDEEKEIYEGDNIVFMYKDIEYIGEVKFEAGTFILCNEYLPDKLYNLFRNNSI